MEQGMPGEEKQKQKNQWIGILKSEKVAFRFKMLMNWEKTVCFKMLERCNSQ